MNEVSNIKVIIFDFDGVIIDSMEVRDYGFRKIFENYSTYEVDELIKYHRINGGLSRFNKIRYFYEKILNEDILEDKIINYADKFSNIMRQELIKDKYLIQNCVSFIKNNSDKYEMHIASGSEEKELRYLCDNLEISKYFKSINGSPTHKNELVKTIIKTNYYNNKEVVIIGDSINDYEASCANNIQFIGYNNMNLRKLNEIYLEDLDQIKDILK